jgi:hypothetical protein
VNNSTPQTGTRLLYVSMVEPLALILARLAVPGEYRLVLCGPYPDTSQEMRRWLEVDGGWQGRIAAARANGHVEASYTHLDHPGGRVRVTSAASWFGRQTLSPDQARRLFERLQWHLKREFDREESVPLVTPAAAGIALWRREMEGIYPELDASHQQLIRETSGQARSEVLTLPELERIPEFGYWDMRLAYPSVSENLPVGPVVREDRGFGELTIPPVGRVHVRFSAPKDWGHVGLLPVKVWGASHLTFPREGQGWCDAREARLAMQAGWRVEVLERLVMQEGRPLNTWLRRLKRLWQYFDDEGDSETLRDAIRRIMLATPADMFGRGREVAEVRTALSGREVEVSVKQARRTERVSHPEWPAAIWARTRYRLAKFMLSAPREVLLGCNLDCAYTAGDPGWRDRGEWGDMRLKGALLMDGPAPRTRDALQELAAIASRSEREELGEEEREEEADELAD